MQTSLAIYSYVWDSEEYWTRFDFFQPISTTSKNLAELSKVSYSNTFSRNSDTKKIINQTGDLTRSWFT